MASNSGANLRVRISADLADIKQGLGLLRGELAKVKADAAKAAPDTGVWTAGISKIRQELGNLAGAYVGIQTITGGIRSLFDALDRADRIGELAAQAGVSTEELSKLAYGAQFSGVQIESLTDSMVKLNRGLFTNEPLLKKIGITTRDSAGNFRSASDLVKDLSDVFQQLPDGPEKAALAVKLFGKSGADIIPFLNEGRNALEEYGAEAERTGNVIKQGASNASAEFRDNLDRLKATMAGLANETVRNLVPAIAQYAQTAVAAGEGANVAAEGGKFLSTVLKILASGAIVVKNVVEGLTNVIGFLGTVATNVADLMAGTLIRSMSVFSNAARGLLTGKNPIDVFGDAIKDAIVVLRQNKAALSSTWTSIQGGFMAAKDGIAESAKDIADIGKLFAGAEAEAKKATDAIGNGSDQASPAAQKLLDTLRQLLDTGGGNGNGGSKTKDKIDQLTASTELLQDAAKRALDSLDKQFEDQKIGIADYYGKRVALQQQLIDLQIEQLQGELAVSKELDKRRSLEEQIIILQRDRQGIAVDAAREQEKAEKELNKTKLEGYRNQLSGLTGGLSAVEGSISAQMQAGSLGYVEGERRLQEVRKQTLEQLRALRAEQAAYVASLAPGDPNMAAAQEGLLGIDTAIANVTTSMQQMRQDTMDVGVSALGSFFSNLRDGAMSAAEAFRSLVGDFAKGIGPGHGQAAGQRGGQPVWRWQDRGPGSSAGRGRAVQRCHGNHHRRWDHRLRCKPAEQVGAGADIGGDHADDRQLDGQLWRRARGRPRRWAEADTQRHQPDGVRGRAALPRRRHRGPPE